jgi:dTDP-4-dehydrorhamnose reductase
MRLLITGAAGMLGQDLAHSASAEGFDVIALARARLDIADAAAVDAAVRGARPDVVVNCAAYTNVDGAETEPELAETVNGPGAGNVARAAAAAGAWTIHISSDYVFDGSANEPYVESDPVNPISAYGRSKLAGEQAVLAAAPESHTIVRSSWLFGAAGPCFPATILRLAAERPELTVVDDQVGCPTFTGHLADALVTLAREPEPEPEPGPGPEREPEPGPEPGPGPRRPLRGIVHVAGSGRCSWYQFAREIVARAGLECEVRPGTTADLGRPAPRPAFSVLATERGSEVPRLPDWREGLSDYLSLAVPAR